GYSDIGCYGGEIETPNLDALAENGIRYTQFYNCARCCPTRASLLTGLYTHRAGIGHMTKPVDDKGWAAAKKRAAYQGYLNENTVTLAEVLEGAGYQTYMSGKWHVGFNEENWPTNRGFDDYYGIIGGACNYFKPEPARALLGGDQPVAADQEDYYTTDYFSKYAAQFIEDADSDKPFFLYLAYNCPHWPLQAWPEDIAKYKDKYLCGWDKLRGERFKRQKEMGLFDDSVTLSPRDPEAPAWDEVEDKEEWAHRMAVYAAMVDRMDQGIGQVIQKLKDKGEFENTIIMFLADNGACAEPYNPQPDIPAGPVESNTGVWLPWANASNTPFRLFKHWLHEGGSATPFIVHWPDKVKAQRIEQNYYAQVKDFMATFMEVAGAEYPETYNGNDILSSDSKSILGNILGESAENGETIYLEHEGNRAVRSGDWKLVSYYGEDRGWVNRKVGRGRRTGPWELYNMKEDRTELNDLSDAHPDLKADLIQQFEKFAEETCVEDWEVIQRELGHIDDESVR
ncbi:MAG: arylsulfatase, partial [Candidatus Latescibacteria bacterium]|nr:arylsulfatase [Candidatus Latescibacterota bacterium]